MNGTVYAFVVGIDDYPAPVRKLHGCKNDIQAFEAFLGERLPKEQLKLLKQVDAEATRANIIAGFRNHLKQAGPGDVALFYYSGHGSQADTPPELWAIEPDRKDETLVCYDSRQPGSYDLADKELALLIEEVAQQAGHVVLVLDCCHSGSGTRAAQEDGVGERLQAKDSRARPLESFLFSKDQAARLVKRGQGSDWVKLPQGRHVVLAACQPHQTAKETPEARGAFSLALMEALKQPGSLNYRDLIKRASTQVVRTVSQQDPSLYATNPADLQLGFLGGVLPPRDPYFTLSHGVAGWWIDGGGVHGVQAPVGDECAVLAVFDLNAQGQAPLGTATVQKVEGANSEVRLEAGLDLNPDLTYRAVVVASPMPPMGVWLSGDEEGLALVRQEIARRDAQQLLFKEVQTEAEAKLVLRAEEGKYRFTRPAAQRSVVGALLGYTPEKARQGVDRLQHMARWVQMYELKNKGTRLSEDAVKLSVYLQTPTGEQELDLSKPIRLSYQHIEGKWKNPTVRLELTNTTDKNLHVAILDLTEAYKISSELTPEALILEPNKALTLLNGPIGLSLPDDFYRQGISEFSDHLLLLVNEDPFDPTVQDQGALDARDRAAPAQKGLPRNNLERLMQRVGTRDLAPVSKENLTDWRSNLYTFTTVRPQEQKTLDAQKAVHLDYGGVALSIDPHPAFEAQVRLAPIAMVSRGDGEAEHPVPPALRNLEGVELVEFKAGQGQDPGLKQLQLTAIKNHEAVTSEHPLTLRLGIPLKKGEYLLATSFDPLTKLYIPLGIGTPDAGKAKVVLEQLPPPTPLELPGERDLISSLGMMFHKLASEIFGIPYNHPQLSAIEVSDEGQVDYISDLEAIKTKVQEARRILLFVHGIQGHSREVVWMARTCPPGQEDALAFRYDLLLAFDYENINTSVIKNAEALRQRLISVGLGPNHGKTLHIVAHSLGGLVSRWMLERCNGGADKMVQHLVLMGTPSGGSPWGNVQQFASSTLAAALNGLGAIAWPAHIISWILQGIELVDTTLDEMTPGSEFLAQLAASPDPGVPYTVFGGNSSYKAAALETGLLQKLFNLSELVRSGAEALFGGQPNDIAASVKSVFNIPTARNPAPKLLEVPSDHFCYLEPSVGLEDVLKALPRG